MFPAPVTHVGTAANLLGERACRPTNKDAAPGRLVGQSRISGLLLAASQSCIWLFPEIIPLLSALFNIATASVQKCIFEPQTNSTADRRLRFFPMNFP